MTILFTAIALSAAPAPASAEPAPPVRTMHAQYAQHAQPAQPVTKPQGAMCSCCKQMSGSGTMGCCSMRGESDGGRHSAHSGNR